MVLLSAFTHGGVHSCMFWEEVFIGSSLFPLLPDPQGSNTLSSARPFCRAVSDLEPADHGQKLGAKISLSSLSGECCIVYHRKMAETHMLV